MADEPSSRTWQESIAPHLVLISFGGAALELAIALSTVLSGTPVVPQWVPFVLLPGLFVVMAPLGNHFNIGFKALATRFDPLTAMVICLLFFVAWFVALWSILHIGGQPGHAHGHYYVDDHGYNQPVTYSGYVYALDLQERIFTLIPGSLYAGAGLVHLGVPSGRTPGPLAGP